MSLAGLQSSWSPAINSYGGGGGGSSITNGTDPSVGTVSVSADGVVAVSSTNAVNPGAGVIFLETPLSGSVVISPTLADDTTVAGPVLFSAGSHDPLKSYGKGSVVEDLVLGDFYVAGAPITVGVVPPAGDWVRLSSPSTITRTDVTGGTATVSTVLGDVTASAETGNILVEASGGGDIIIHSGTAPAAQGVGNVLVHASNNLILSNASLDGDISGASIVIQSGPNAGPYGDVFVSRSQIAFQLVALDSATPPALVTSRMSLRPVYAPTTATTDGLVITPTAMYFNGGLVTVAPPP